MLKTTISNYEKLTSQIIEAIEKGAGQWQMPWHGGNSRPKNVTGRAYRGVNVLTLWATSQAHNYSDSLWGTYNQWQAEGAQVKKGAKGTMVVFWKPIDRVNSASEAEDSDCSADEGLKRSTGLICRSSYVFNIEQVEGYEKKTKAKQPGVIIEPIVEVESFFANLHADIRHGGSRAYYRPTQDYIQMPNMSDFYQVEGYYSTLAHEYVHWTGHSSRLARDLKSRFGSEDYAAEELVAELGSAFLSSDLGMTNQPRPDHAAYLASWLQLLKDDSKAIFTAASKAQAAVDWLHEKAQSQQALLCA